MRRLFAIALGYEASTFADVPFHKASDSPSPSTTRYEPYLAIENIEHTRTKARSPQTNGICERFQKTLLDEFYRIAFRKKYYWSISDLQRDLERDAPTPGAAASARRRCRPSSTLWRLRRRS